jgi:formate hydrogenlyase subunit 4
MDKNIDAPRLFCAVYFAFLSIITTLFLEFTIYSVGLKQIAPVFLTLILGIIIALIFGGLFGKLIINSRPPYKLRCFGIGVALFLSGLPFYDVGLLFLIKVYRPDLYQVSDNLRSYAAFYLYILIFSFFTVGCWLSLLSGAASLYLRHRFVPGFLAFLNDSERKPH